MVIKIQNVTLYNYEQSRIVNIAKCSAVKFHEHIYSLFPF